jgi:nicotinate-nucleotide adenylyltransferase
MSSARRIGIFGGSFNPPHAAHQLVALYVLETQPVDELWLVPTWAHPFGKDLASYADRVAMCELAAVALGPRVRVSRAEEELAQRPGFVASRTLDLIEYLEAPDRELRLVIGADILGETAAWHRWDEVARRAPPIVVRRHGYAGGVGIDLPAVSSTQVREQVRAVAARGTHPGGDPSLAGLLPREVLRYIADRRLYG